MLGPADGSSSSCPPHRQTRSGEEAKQGRQRLRTPLVDTGGELHQGGCRAVIAADDVGVIGRVEADRARPIANRPQPRSPRLFPRARLYP